MPWKRSMIAIVTAALCLAALLMLDRWQLSPYLHAQNLLQDAIARAGRTTPANPNLVFLAIDSNSVGLDEEADVEGLYELGDSAAPEARALRLMSKLWPWPREVYALVVERLVKAGAKAVLFDLTFPTSTEGDEPFRAALERFRGEVVIGSNFVATTTRSGPSVPSHSRPPESLVPQTVPMDDRVAYTNFWPDSDEVVRRAHFRVTTEQLEERIPTTDSEQFLSLVARGLTKAGFGERVPPGLDEHLFRYTAGPREGFPPRSLFEIFVPEYWARNYQDGAFFRDKIVIVGAEGNWQHDEHATPFGSMPGPELHLNAMNAALHGEFIRELPSRWGTFVTVFAGALAVALTLSLRSPWWRLLACAAVQIAFVAGALQAFNHLSTYIPCLPALIELNVTILFGLVCDFAWERREKTRVRRTLERYVSRDVVQQMLAHPKLYAQSLGGVIKPAAILFSDIRGYSTVSARSNPHVLVTQLNEYLTAMVECVFRYGGTLDKFIGDAVMAVWGNVQTQGVRTDTANAVRCALAMREELARLNHDWKSRGLPELRIGIAVNQGDVVVGNIGSPQRMEFTVIGDVVNTSWRLQELTKELGAELIISAGVTALVVEDFEVRSLGKTLIRGQSEEMEVFALLGAIEPSAGLVRDLPMASSRV